MNSSFKLTENILRSLSTEQSFERGRQYYRAGVINNATRQGNLLTALCEGSSAPAYRLRVELDQAGVRSASCTCPYDWGGLCKHLVALLLAYIHQPETFTERGSVADLLAGLERDDLVALVEKLAFRDPDLYDWLETSVSELGAKKQPVIRGYRLVPPLRKTNARRRSPSRPIAARSRTSCAAWMACPLPRLIGA